MAFSKPKSAEAEKAFYIQIAKERLPISYNGVTILEPTVEEIKNLPEIAKFTYLAPFIFSVKSKDEEFCPTSIVTGYVVSDYIWQNCWTIAYLGCRNSKTKAGKERLKDNLQMVHAVQKQEQIEGYIRRSGGFLSEADALKLVENPELNMIL